MERKHGPQGSRLTGRYEERKRSGDVELRAPQHLLARVPNLDVLALRAPYRRQREI